MPTTRFNSAYTSWSDAMRKAISLRLNLWIEGDDEPAHDFAESAKQAVREIVEAGASKHPELRITICSVEEAEGEGELCVKST